MLKKTHARQYKRFKRGTNQYRRRPRITVNGLVGAFFVLTITFLALMHYSAIGIAIVYSSTEKWAVSTFNPIAYAPTKIISPLPLDSVEEPDVVVSEPSSKWEGFKEKVKKLAPIYGIPPKVIVAQAALESNRGQSTFAKERNNYFGLAAYDSNPNAAWSFDNEEQAIVIYMQTIKKNFPEAYAARSNPEKMIRLLKVNSSGKMYASDPHYVAKLMSLPEWRDN